MWAEAGGDSARVEYRFLKFSTHDQAEKGLNEAIADGWQFVSYQAAGGDSAVLHFLLLSRERRRSERSMGFGPIR